MRRFAAILFSVLMVLTLCSCSSSKNADDLAESIRTKMAEVNTLDISTSVRADYGQRAYDFELHFTGNEKEGIIEVKSPESIAGSIIKISDGKVNTEFDGITLYMGQVSEIQETPACALVTLIDSWKNGYITDSVFETLNDIDAVAVTAYVSETCETRTWYNVDTMLPFYAEVITQGQTSLFCTLNQVTCSG